MEPPYSICDKAIADVYDSKTRKYRVTIKLSKTKYLVGICEKQLQIYYNKSIIIDDFQKTSKYQVSIKLSETKF